MSQDVRNAQRNIFLTNTSASCNTELHCSNATRELHKQAYTTLPYNNEFTTRDYTSCNLILQFPSPNLRALHLILVYALLALFILSFNKLLGAVHVLFIIAPKYRYSSIFFSAILLQYIFPSQLQSITSDFLVLIRS